VWAAGQQRQASHSSRRRLGPHPATGLWQAPSSCAFWLDRATIDRLTALKIILLGPDPEARSAVLTLEAAASSTRAGGVPAPRRSEVRIPSAPPATRPHGGRISSSRIQLIRRFPSPYAGASSALCCPAKAEPDCRPRRQSRSKVNSCPERRRNHNDSLPFYSIGREYFFE
jgi:hypothetical protein